MNAYVPKSIFALGLLLLCALMAQPTQDYTLTDKLATTATTEPCNTKNTVFQPGEKIVYKLYYNWNFVWLSAGEVTFTVQETDQNYHLTAVGETYESYEWFYKVRDNYQSFVDKETLLPRLSLINIQEGKHTRYERVTYNQVGGSMIYLRGKNRDDAQKTVMPLDGCMHDILSTVYWCRNIDFDQLEAGQKIPIKFFLDRETYPLKVSYIGREDKKKIKGLGRFKTQRFSPQLVAGDIFNEGDEMQVWVSDDQNHIPLLIESPVSVGSIKAVLKEYDGLKYELSSKIK